MFGVLFEVGSCLFQLYVLIEVIDEMCVVDEEIFGFLVVLFCFSFE